MRKLGTLFAILAFATPLLASASTTRPPIDPSKCSAGNSTELSSPLSQLFTQSTDPNAAKAWIQNGIYCPNACYDLTVSLTLTYSGLQVQIAGTNKCSSSTKAPNDPAQSTPRGCSAGLQQPQLTIMTKDVYSSVIGFRVPDQSVQRSRCDESVIDSSMNNFFSGLNQVTSDPQGAQQQMQSALSQFQSAPNPQAPAAPLVPPYNPAQTAQTALQNPQPATLVQTLVTLGATPQQAQSAVNGDPATVQTLLSALSTGDTQTAVSAAQTLNLNPGLQNGVVTLNVTPSPGNPAGTIVGTPVPIGTPTGAPASPTFTPGTTLVSGQPYATSFGLASGSSNGFSSLLSSIVALFSRIVSGIQSSFSNSAAPTQTTLPTQTTDTSTTPPPAATVVATPSTISVGGTISLAWSSVGANSCTLTENSNTIGNGLGGTQTVSATSSGVLLFALSCQTSVGTTVANSATVLVH